MRDPDLAIWLLTAVIVTSLLFSSAWADVRNAIAQGFKAAGTKANNG